MIKILVATNHQKKMKFLTDFFRQIGFDVETLSNLNLLSNTLVEFFPSLIVTEYSSENSFGLELIKKLKKNNGLPKVLVFSQSQVMAEYEKVDALIESPVRMEIFLSTFCDVTASLQSDLLKKIEPIQEKLKEEQKKIDSPFFYLKNQLNSPVADRSKFSTQMNLADEKRAQKEKFYSILTRDLDDSAGKKSFSADDVKKYRSSLRKLDYKEDESIRLARKEFVESLVEQKKVKKAS